jgi:hypothetical protein
VTRSRRSSSDFDITTRGSSAQRLSGSLAQSSAAHPLNSHGRSSLGRNQTDTRVSEASLSSARSMLQLGYRDKFQRTQLNRTTTHLIQELTDASSFVIDSELFFVMAGQVLV